MNFLPTSFLNISILLWWSLVATPDECGRAAPTQMSAEYIGRGRFAGRGSGRHALSRLLISVVPTADASDGATAIELLQGPEILSRSSVSHLIQQTLIYAWYWSQRAC